MKCIRYSTGLAAVLCATTATADVTAQQVWDNWTAQMAVYGQGFTTTGEVASDDALVVEGLSIRMTDDDASVTAAIGTLTLSENRDGTVTVMMPDSYPITIETTPNFGEPTLANITVTQDAMALRVSGEPDAMVYDVTADRYALRLDSLTGGQSINVEVVEAVVAILDLSGTYSVTADTLTRIAYDMAIGAMDIDVEFNEADGNGTFTLNGDMADLNIFAKVAAPPDIDMQADQPPFAEGLAIDAGYTFGPVSYAFVADAPSNSRSGSMSSDGGELAVTVDVDGVSYIAESRDLDVSFAQTDAFPALVDITMAQYGVDVQIPLSQGDGDPRDARLAFNITDLIVSETVWAMFDAGGVLPRTPLTVALGIDAQVTPFFDFLDPAQQEAAMMTDVPGELNSAQITELTIRGAGAEMTGDGAFTFDNSDLETFDGLPRPLGQMSFAINGANALIDNLTEMGLIAGQDAMVPRMMLGMFTTPVGEDMLSATIEVNAEGHLLANGQRLR